MKINQIRTRAPTELLVAAAATLAVAFFAFALVADTHAQTTTTAVSPTAASADTLPPMMVSIDAAGNALVRGTVLSTGANSLTLSSWGGTWTVQTTSASGVTPSTSTLGDMSGIRAGDFVGVDGTVGSGSWTVNASVVHDWTQNPLAATTAPASVDTTGVVSTSMPTSTSMLPTGDTLYTGTVSDASNLSNSSFMLSDGSGATYTVNVAPDATVWNSASTDISLSNVAQGDSIRLDGSLAADGSISADVVRDTSQ